MYPQYAQMTHVALAFAQSTLKNVASAVFNCASRCQNKSPSQIGHCKTFPFTSTRSGSFFPNKPMVPPKKYDGDPKGF